MTKQWGPPPWSWPGITALILALALGLGWATTLIVASLPATPQISEKGLELLNGIGQVLAGAVATFIGASIGAQHDPRPEIAVRGAVATDAAAAAKAGADEKSPPEPPTGPGEVYSPPRQ